MHGHYQNTHDASCASLALADLVAPIARGAHADHTGSDVIAFNRGEGQDSVTVSGATRVTLSLGEAIAYSDLDLRKLGNDLVLETAASGDSLTFTGWYTLGTNQPSSMGLQVLTEASGAHDAGSADPLLYKKVLGDASFGVQAQTLRPLTDSQTGAVRLA